MDGFIKICVHEDKDSELVISVENRMKDVSEVDRVYMLDAFASAFDMDASDIIAAVKCLQLLQDKKQTIKVDEDALKRLGLM